MRRKKPELTAVHLIPWDKRNGVYGVLTTYDDGVVEREPWGDLLYTERTVAIRRKDVRVLSPRRS
jgi:hypothetical protein